MMLSFLLLAAMLQTAPNMEIRAETVGPGHYRYSVAEPFPESQLTAIQARMETMAKAQCGNLALRWGKYSSDRLQGGDTGTEMRWTNYKQAFACYDPATDPYKPVAETWQPSKQDDADAMAYAKRYMAAIDRNDVATVVRMLEPMLEMTPAEMTPYVTDYRARALPSSRQFADIQWARNPTIAAHPGAYAVAYFSGERFCGYFVLWREGPGKYWVSRQDLIGFKPGDQITDDDIAQLSKRCAEL